MSIYNIKDLLAAIAGGQTFEYLLFYGHKASPDGAITDSCCSQWFPARFEIDGIKYLTAEHFMMAEKARLFGDKDILEKVLSCKTPKDAKALGRKVKNFDQSIWGYKCFEVVVRANKAKFLQNPPMAEWLRLSAPAILVEASPSDRIWGIGLSKTEQAALDPHMWEGSNLLGFALTRVRDEL